MLDNKPKNITVVVCSKSHTEWVRNFVDCLHKVDGSIGEMNKYTQICFLWNCVSDKNELKNENEFADLVDELIDDCEQLGTCVFNPDGGWEIAGYKLAFDKYAWFDSVMVLQCTTEVLDRAFWSTIYNEEWKMAPVDILGTENCYMHKVPMHLLRSMQWDRIPRYMARGEHSDKGMPISKQDAVYNEKQFIDMLVRHRGQSFIKAIPQQAYKVTREKRFGRDNYVTRSSLFAKYRGYWGQSNYSWENKWNKT